MYFDPDGEWIALAFCILTGAYMGGVNQSGSWNPVNWNWSSGQVWGGIFVGAVAGWAGFEVAGAVMAAFPEFGTVGATVVQGGAISGMASGSAGGAVTGLINGTGQALVGGKSIEQALQQGSFRFTKLLISSASYTCFFVNRLIYSFGNEQNSP